jgi:uncharacterized membrane-anchored protein YjiN (DUF445 family)
LPRTAAWEIWKMAEPNRFDYVRYDDEAVEQQNKFKKMFKELEDAVENDLGRGRPQSLVMTKLEEAYMWVGKAIRDEQIRRNGSAPMQDERTNS